MEENKNITTKDGLLCILCSLLIGFIYDRLFVDKVYGISYFIFVGLCIIFFLWFTREKISFGKNFGCFLLIPIALLSFSFTMHTETVFYFLNSLLVPVLMIASSTLIVKPMSKWDEGSFIVEILRNGIANVFRNLDKPFKIIKASIKIDKSIKITEEKKQILIGVIIALPLLVVIITLLSSADMVFGYYFANATKIFNKINIEEFVPHVILSLVVALYLFGYVWGMKNEEKEHEKDISTSKMSWGLVAVITVLVALNIIYLLFTIIQFSYLYGGGVIALPANFTYAEYARKGFFELAAVTFINFIIVVTCLKYMNKSNNKLQNITKILLSVLVAFNLNMLFSANFKLTLYEDTYGYTFLRVSVHLFMLLLFILCLIVATGIWCRKIHIVKNIIIITIIMYTVINYINIDGIIARKNIKRYYGTGNIDIVYLTSLSSEVVPYLLELKDNSDSNIKMIIEDNLNHRKQVLDKEKSWTEFNFSKNKVRKLISQEK